MPYPYITQIQLEDRLGREVVKRLFDELNIGEAEPSPLLQLARDSSSRVAAALRASRRNYNMAAITANTPDEVVRLSLDVAHYYACRRYPEVMRQNWAELGDAIKQELKDLVKGDMLLDTEVEPEDPAPPPAGGTAAISSDCGRGW